ncbi:UvrD-helicase domain-containing protein [Paenibacillus albicereus]|uniref:UvrD-helicase domain-containing protein n=1 Tax=Paenibacillus albicereus TaxID=2726185 RepID=A0A6H2GXL5_9BACL|nr:RNA polymerase recycling motor HelD [Paenibacillus albicereus]QJC52173.1 UvrD-helicase domain-containing protein [Paenibacillus albicereus]
MDAGEWKKEQARVDAVRGQLKKRIARDEPIVSELKAQVVGIRSEFWDDVTVNLAESDDRIETAVSMKQQAEVLSERERSHRALRSGLQKMRRLLPAPYFGRIDLVEEGTDGTPEQAYVGVASFLADDGETFLVYDWRTPIASLYYDYGPGAVRYETPGGEIAGEMTLKRQFSIREGRIRSMFDTGMTIGDELLQDVLSRTSSSQMQAIVGTIQQDQNAIIRNDRARLLIVQGAAGSGKTSAALQRVAYLLYKHRSRISAEQMVLFSPNPMFSSYISSVLPELGEENIKQTTFQDYLELRLGRRYELEDAAEQLEAVLAGPEADDSIRLRAASISCKSSVRFLERIEAFASGLLRSGMRFKGFRLRGRVVVGRSQLTERFYAMDASIRLPNRIELLKEWLLEELERLETAEREADWVREEIEFLDDDQYRKIHKTLRRQRAGADEEESVLEERLLRTEVARRAFRPLRRLAESLAWIDAAGLYKDLFRGEQAENAAEERWSEIAARTLSALDDGRLLHEDAAPLLYLTELVQGFRMNTSIRYVIVDEAQDFSPFQFHFLKRLFPMAKITALGDFNQAIFAHSTELAASAWLQRLYGPDQTETIVLRRSYRSTRPIVEFTRSLLPDGTAIEPFDRPGELPVLVRAGSAEERDRLLGADLLKLAAGEAASIAVICRTEGESQSAWEALRAIPGLESLKRVTKDTAKFESGMLVIPAYLAKGVEFDAVLLYDASADAYGEERLRKLFYTACTRAMHVLRLYAAGAASPFFADASPGSFRVVEPARP